MDTDGIRITERQRKLIDFLAGTLRLTPADLETITINSWGQTIEWPLDRKSASKLITELQLMRQREQERRP